MLDKILCFFGICVRDPEYCAWRQTVQEKLNQSKVISGLNIFYYVNAVSVAKVDGALRCEITKSALDKVLLESGEKIVLLQDETPRNRTD